MIYSTVITRFSIFFIRIVALVLCFSCNEKQKEESKMDQALKYKVDLTDKFISEMILNYVDSNKLQPKKSVISLNIKTDTYRTVLYIRHSNIHLKKYSLFPSHYTFVGEYLVLLYSDINKFLKNEFIQDELIHVCENNDFDLSMSETLDDNPTWKVTKCEDHISITREADEIELPCFLKLGIKGEQIVIEEEEWFKDLKKSKLK